jgi:hypothetical protein
VWQEIAKLPGFYFGPRRETVLRDVGCEGEDWVNIIADRHSLFTRLH